MTFDQAVDYASRYGYTSIYSGICSGDFCNKEFYGVKIAQRYCYEGCNTSKGKGKFICTVCKNEFFRKNVFMERTKKPFCGLVCYEKFNKGENHSGYKGKNFVNAHGYKMITVN